MEEGTPNRLKISQLGHQMLRQLPTEPEDIEPEPEGPAWRTPSLLKGTSIDFFSFAARTQKLLLRRTCSLRRHEAMGSSCPESQRKFQLHHEQWVSEQRLVRHKMADLQNRLLQQKGREFDWRGVGSRLKESCSAILVPVQVNAGNRVVRKRQKLQRLLVRKYPERQTR